MNEREMRTYVRKHGWRRASADADTGQPRWRHPALAKPFGWSTEEAYRAQQQIESPSRVANGRINIDGAGWVDVDRLTKGRGGA